MTKQLLKDALGWGIILWIIGYILGIVLFFVFPPTLIGWIILPLGLIITAFVLLKKIKESDFLYYVKLAVVWTMIAVVLDYILIVKTFNPPDGYYKLDVYLYYALTFVLPLIIGWRKWPRHDLKNGKS